MSNARSELIVSPVGRFISGSMTELVKQDFDKKPIPEDEQYYTFGVAFSKADPATTPMIESMVGFAWNAYAQFPAIQAVIQNRAFGVKGFSWKITDGDTPDQQGKFNENARGHYVIYFRNNYKTTTVDQNNADIDPASVKRGFFVQMAFDISANMLQGDRAGIYVNPQLVRFVYFGDEIRGGPDANATFGGAFNGGGALPPGASQTPVSSTPASAQPPVDQGAVQQQAAPPVQQQAAPPVQQQAAPPVQQQAAPPAAGFAAGAPVQQGQPGMQQAAPPVQQVAPPAVGN